MKVHVFRDSAALAKAAASIFLAQLLRKPDSVLGLATGSSPIETYQELIRLHQEGIADFSKATSFNLDEYVGLAADHPQSYVAFMQQQLFGQVNFKASHLPSGVAENLEAECSRYDQAILQAGGIDLQLLGIGSNGHIGFNEPDARFVYNTSIVKLAESTIEANQRFFDSLDQVPRQAISMGIGTIMEARTILLIATGKGKAEAIKGLVQGQIDPLLPASILRAHPDAVILLDKEAASLLKA